MKTEKEIKEKLEKAKIQLVSYFEANNLFMACDFQGIVDTLNWMLEPSKEK